MSKVGRHQKRSAAETAKTEVTVALDRALSDSRLRPGTYHIDGLALPDLNAFRPAEFFAALPEGVQERVGRSDFAEILRTFTGLVVEVYVNRPVDRWRDDYEAGLQKFVGDGS